MGEEILPRKKTRQESSSLEARKAMDDETSKEGTESEREKIEEVIYDPSHFIRCHGTAKNNKGPADTKTQIWDVSFEPDPNDPEKTTNKIATCGGNSICVINIVSGEVLMKYSHKEKGEDFYTITWTLLPHQDGTNRSALVSGSVKGEICMFYPDEKICFYIWPFTKNGEKGKKGSKAINSVVFHSKRKTWLFIGLANGTIYLYDIGSNLVLPEYSGVEPRELLKFEPHLGEIYNIIWTGNESQWLMAGCKAGMVGWQIDEAKVLDTYKDNVYTPITVDFRMPTNDRGDVAGNGSIVDSLDVLNDYTVVSKCVMHGNLYVVDLAKTIHELEGFDMNKSTRTEKEAKIIAKLDWSKTDNFYMNMGCNRLGLICCGDDQGSLWVYEQRSLGKHMAVGDLKYNEKEPDLIKANVRLMWPDLQDVNLENSESHPEKDRYDIIVDKVAVSQDSEHIVAVTSNNMVCIWKRQKPFKKMIKEESA